ncbi:uncharacterized protein LOC144922061 [Branchiostoma floridae x Branchiostoma belcheri]
MDDGIPTKWLYCAALLYFSWSPVFPRTISLNSTAMGVSRLGGNGQLRKPTASSSQDGLTMSRRRWWRSEFCRVNLSCFHEQTLTSKVDVCVCRTNRDNFTVPQNCSVSRAPTLLQFLDSAENSPRLTSICLETKFESKLNRTEMSMDCHIFQIPDFTHSVGFVDPDQVSFPGYRNSSPALLAQRSRARPCLMYLIRGKDILRGSGGLPDAVMSAIGAGVVMMIVSVILCSCRKMK